MNNVYTNIYHRYHLDMSLFLQYLKIQIYIYIYTYIYINRFRFLFNTCKGLQIEYDSSQHCWLFALHTKCIHLFIHT